MRKKILIFIGLKIAEICGVCGIIALSYLNGCFLETIGIENNEIGFMVHILRFLAGMIAILIYFLIGMGIFYAIKANWRWANKLANKK